MVKLAEEELEQLEKLQQEYAAVCQVRGQLEFALRQLQLEIESVNTDHEAIIEREKSLAKSLNEKYGVGTVNLETGEFLSNNNIDGD